MSCGFEANDLASEDAVKESPLTESLTDSLGKCFQPNFSEVDSKEIARKLKGGSNPMLSMIVKRFATEKWQRTFTPEKGEELKPNVFTSEEISKSRCLIAYFLCIQKDILPLIFNKASKKADVVLHRPLCTNNGHQWEKLSWHSVTQQDILKLRQQGKLCKTCMKPSEKYSIESNRFIAESNFLACCQLDDMPNKFPAASQIPGKNCRTILDERRRFAACDFDALPSPPNSIGRDDMVRIIFEAAAKKMLEQALEALQDIVNEAEDTN